MATISEDDFLKGLQASKVIEPQQLEEFLQKTDSDDPKQIAAELVRENLLTKWQAKYLLSGRSRLHVGNYRLLDRIRHDEFGDRFLALQEQLNRRVEIQILPKTLDEKKELRDEFLNSASLAAKVDHPNVVHVYEIDQEKGRFFLVVEHVDGHLLSTFDESEFSLMDVARLVQQSLQGLKAAHDMNIVHGQINKDNLIITDEDQVKIQNLAMASLLSKDHANISPVVDVISIGKLGRKMLKLVESTNTDAKLELARILDEIASVESADIDPHHAKLGSWMEQHDSSSKEALISSTSVIPEKSSPNKRATSAAQSGPKENLPTPSTGAVSFLRRQHPAVVIGVAAVACVSFLCGVAWFAFAMTPDSQLAKQTTTEDSNPVSSSTENLERPSLDSSTPSKKLSGQNPAQAATHNQKISAEELSAAQEKLANIGTQNKPVTNVSVEEPTESSDETTVEISNELSDETTSETAMDIPRDLAPPTDETVAQSLPEDGAVTSPADFDNPFEDFPRFTDLGDIASTQPLEIGNLQIPPNVLMAVELITGAAISKSKIVFELDRSESDKQRWLVSFRKRKSAPSVKIGEFFRSGNSFNFTWDPLAVEDDSHNYLRNCVLRLTGNNDKVSFLSLRAPLEIEGLSVTQENAIVKIETDVQWLPNPEALRIEVIPMPYKGIPKSYMYPPSRLLEKHQAVLIYFVESEKHRFYYLRVDADAKKTLKFQLALMFDPGDGSNPQIAQAKLIQNVTGQLSQLANMAAARYDQVKDAIKPDGMTKGDFDDLKSDLKRAAKETQKRKTVALEYESLFPAFYGKAIPLRVYFNLDDIQVDIAQSSPDE